MVAQATNPHSETRDQKDARMEASVNDYSRVLHELTGRMTGLKDQVISSKEHTKASFGNMKKMFNSSLDEIRYLIATQAAQQPDATRSASAILGSEVPSPGPFTRKHHLPHLLLSPLVHMGQP